MSVGGFTHAFFMKIHLIVQKFAFCHSIKKCNFPNLKIFILKLYY